jgi:heterodisulfide reductase subunit A-like polyferredoxin
MLRAEVNEAACQACVPCLARRVCKIKALMQIDAGEPAMIDVTRCRGCGDCMHACPHAAIVMGNAHLPNRRSVQVMSAGH